MTLEEQLAQIVKTHDLGSLSINVYQRDDGTTWLHANAHSNPVGEYIGTDAQARIVDAITGAINELNERRYAAVEIDPLSPLANTMETIDDLQV
jgi:hypothetical protein